MAITSGLAAVARQDQAPAAAMTPGQRAGSGRSGYLIIRGALTPGQADCSAAATPDHPCDEQSAGTVEVGGPVHVLSATPAAPRRPG
jgi:hypothetical protein